LKNVFRLCDFADTRFVSPVDKPPLPQAECDAVRVYVFDASVWLAKMLGNGKRHGMDAVMVFVDAIVRAFDTYKNVHTVVAAFDRYQYVTDRKKPTQAKRRRKRGDGGVPWVWNGTDPIVTVDGVLPPWSGVLGTAAARRAAIQEIVDILCARLVLNAGTQVIFDYEHELDANGLSPLVLSPSGKRFDSNLHNAYGEADLTCQYFAEYFLKHDTEYGPRGAVLLHSVDTDFVPLSMVTIARLCESEDEARACPALYVQLGDVSYDASFANEGFPVLTTRTDERAIFHTEAFNVTQVALTCHGLFAGKTPFRDGVLSFAAMCFMCGNDYLVGIPGVPRCDTYAAARWFAASDLSLVQMAEGVPSLSRELARKLYLYAHAVKYSLLYGLPKQPLWEIGVDLIKSTHERRRGAPIDDDVLSEYLEGLAWCLQYAFDIAVHPPSLPPTSSPDA